MMGKKLSEIIAGGGGGSAFTAPKARTTAAMRRRLNLRKQLFPDVEEGSLWSRTTFVGFTTVPRTISLIVRIIDDLDKKSAGKIYLDLWCRSFDDYMIEIKDEYECAFAAGYDGQRAIRTWRERISILESLGFIRAKAAPHGAYRYILLLDPHPVIEKLNSEKRISEEAYLAFRSQLLNIGAVKD